MSIFDRAEKRVLSKSELSLVIRHFRETRQWSQDTLAQLAHSTERTIQRIEAGSGASVHTLRALAAALDLKDIDAFTKPMVIPTDEQLPGGNVLYLLGFLEAEAPDELALPWKMI